VGIKLVLPHGGYGLGNDLVPWAKAYILSNELGARLLHPAWGNNPRGYGWYFRTNRFDWQFYRILCKCLPNYRFSEEDYENIGEDDFVAASRKFIELKGLEGKSNYIVRITGLWGRGFEPAYDFIISQLMNTRSTLGTLYAFGQLGNGSSLTVGIHIRRGDFFEEHDGDYLGAVNTAIAMDWYIELCRKLQSSFDVEKIQFLLCSDGKKSEFESFIAETNAVFLSEKNHSDISDLLLLSRADLLICSISTFSLWAAQLSKSPYIWYGPNIGDETVGGRSRRWGPDYDNGQCTDPRCFPLGTGDSLPRDLVNHLKNVLDQKRIRMTPHGSYFD
jgi:hypothetical protein